MVVGSAEKNLIHVRGSYSTAIPTTKKTPWFETTLPVGKQCLDAI